MERQLKKITCLHNVSSVFQTLDYLLKPNFGPIGRSTLLTTSTGQVLITNVGASILECLNIDHPIGRLVTRSISKCQHYSGDGSKTFMLYLTGIFSDLSSNVDSINDQRTLLASACQTLNYSLFKSIIFPTILEQCVVMNYCENRNATVSMMTDIVCTYLSGKYPAGTCHHLSQTLVEFVSSELDDFLRLPAAVEACIINFNLLCVEGEGMLPSSTAIIKGIIIQTDFLFFNSRLSVVSPAKFVILQLSMEKQKSSEVQSIFLASNSAAMNSAFEWKTRHYSWLTNWLMEHQVNAVLSNKQIGDTLNGLCMAAGISTVQYVDEDDLLRVMTTFNICSIEGISDLAQDDSKSNVGQAEFCNAFVLGNKQFVHLGPPLKKKSEGLDTSCVAKQLLVYGMSAGACRQVSLDLNSSVKVLRAWLEGDQYLDNKNPTARLHNASQYAVHINGGGTFEMAVRRAIQKHLKETCLMPDQVKRLSAVFWSALCSAVTEVPLRLLQNSYHQHQASLAAIERLAGDRLTVIGINGRTGRPLDSNSRIIEPLANKMRTICCVLELTGQILRLDCIIGIKKLHAF